MMKTVLWIQKPKVYEPLYCIASGFLLALCFPPFYFSIFVVFALLPVFYTIKPKQAKRNYCKGLLTGISFYLPLLYWIGHATVPGMILLVFYLTILFAIPFGIYYLTPQKWLRPVVFGVVWGLIEYFRSIGYFSFAWGFLSHTFYNLPLITWSYYIPFPILSALIAALYSFDYEFDMFIKSKSKAWNLSYRNIMRNAKYGLAFILVMVFLQLIYFSKPVEKQSNPTKERQLKVALLQGDFGMEAEDRYDDRKPMDVYIDLAMQSMQHSPDLIILPESAINVSLNYSPGYIQRFSEFVDAHDVEMLVGAIHGLYDGEGSWQFWNRAYLFSPGQKFDYTQTPVIVAGMQTYDKMHLVPYGEWVPLGHLPVFGWIETLIEEAGAGIFQRGNEQTIFELRNGAKFAVAICFESTLSSQMHNAKQNGADFLVNITYDAWFKRSPGLPQHLMQSQFRAAENGCYVLRCASTGITAVIAPNGQIQKRIPDNEVGYLFDTIYY